MVILGVLYAFVGIVFAVPASHVKVWRLAAWLVSAVAYAAHICYGVAAVMARWDPDGPAVLNRAGE